MKTIVLMMFSACALLGGSWESLQRLTPGESIELTRSDGKARTVTCGSASGESLVVRTNAGEESVAKADVARVRVKDAGRRMRRGALFTAIGAGVGAGFGVAVCPGCFNEGAGAKYVGPGIAAAAGIGALGFLTSAYRTVYLREKAK